MTSTWMVKLWCMVLAAGLLTKSYFLVFVPLYLFAAMAWYRKGTMPALGLVTLLAIPLVLAGPWYVRNLTLYGNLSGHLGETNGSSVTSAP